MSKDTTENIWIIFFEKIRWIKLNTKQSPNSIFFSIIKEFPDIYGLSHTSLETKFHEFYKDHKIPTKAKFGVNNEVGVEDLIKYLEKKYPKSIKSIISNSVNSVFYIYYYESLHGEIKKAILKFNLREIEKDTKEWHNGEIYYPSNNGYVTLFLERVLPGEGEKANPEFIYFKLSSKEDEYKHQINFFTIKLANKPISKRFQLVVSTSSLTFDPSDSNKIPVLLFCIIREVSYSEIESKLVEETDSWIIEKLEKMKLSWPSNGTLFTSPERFVEFKGKNS